MFRFIGSPMQYSWLLLLIALAGNVIGPTSYMAAAQVQLPYPLQPYPNFGQPKTPYQNDVTAPRLLDVIEIDTPVTIPNGELCQVTLMKYNFANSYGRPFVSSYVPPRCKFNRVVLNFTATSAGRQFDRLAMMFLNDTEIWRTSTAEPTASGIEWVYIKDVSNYLPLWAQPQKIIFDLGNIVDDIYTGPFNTTLTATFFNSRVKYKSADMIVPISANRSSQGLDSSFKYPEVNASAAITIPRNAKRAVVSIAACGQIDEEFWWSNVFTRDTHVFANNTLLGYSPFREVQLLIDGALAGVVWPFPVIFTGGIVPGFWRPLVGIDTFDLKEDEIDITPWIPYLSDGLPHTYEIRVVGVIDDGLGGAVFSTVGNYWVITGKIFLWLDQGGEITMGTNILAENGIPLFKTYSKQINSSAEGIRLDYSVSAERHLEMSAFITTSEGTFPARWVQSLAFSNVGNVSGGGFDQMNSQITTGFAASSSGYFLRFRYPIKVLSTFEQDSVRQTLRIDGKLDRAKEMQAFGPSAFPSGLNSFGKGYDGWSLATRQNGSASYLSVGRNYSRSTGMTEQDYRYFGLNRTPRGEDSDMPGITGYDLLYSRHVLAVNGSIAYDSIHPQIKPPLPQPSKTGPSRPMPTKPKEPVTDNDDRDEDEDKRADEDKGDEKEDHENEKEDGDDAQTETSHQDLSHARHSDGDDDNDDDDDVKLRVIDRV